MKSKDLSKFSIRSDIALDLIDTNNSNIIKEKHESIYSLNRNTLKKELDKFLEFKSKEEIEDILKEYQIEMGKIYEY